jgi:tetratricopeptide (TPR) repeat protein
MDVPTPSRDESLAFAIKLMREGRFTDAERICRAWLERSPGCAGHLRVLGHSLMKQERLDESEETLRFALSLEPGMPQLEEDMGSVLALQERYGEAIVHLERAIRQDPARPLPYKKLGHALVGAGRASEADEMFRNFMERDPGKSVVAQAIVHIQEGRVEEGEQLLRGALKTDPDNVDAMRYLASTMLSGKKKNQADAEALLRRATQLAPDYLDVWLLLGSTLLERSKYLEAIPVFAKAAELGPTRAETWGGLAHAHARASHPEEAAEAYARSVDLKPDAPMVQMGYAHALKTLGDQPGSLRAYRAAIQAKPDFGEVYWSMANLKIFRFEEEEVEAMEYQLEEGDLSESAEIHFCFALGKAWEDKLDYDKAWHYYENGNKLQRMLVDHDPVEMEVRQENIIEIFDREFLEKNADNGCMDPDPIFIVGLPRSGSTLVEQILASHSQVEGTSELPILTSIAGSMGRYRTDGKQYPELAKELRKQDWRAYGKQYMEESSRHRATDAPFFTDKLPNNFPHVGLLHLILPNAKIINARRHPLDSCLGAFKQLWGMGQHFTYDVMDLAEYYRQYHKIMTHWHTVLPGKVLDVHYEETVLDLEAQVRRILDHCGLPFEEQCLRFHETERAVNTASSEQVRQPIYRDALGKWRRYEKHLDYWKEELAGIIDELPESVRNAGL